MVINALFADGSVMYPPRTMTPATLSALITLTAKRRAFVPHLNSVDPMVNTFLLDKHVPSAAVLPAGVAGLTAAPLLAQSTKPKKPYKAVGF